MSFAGFFERVALTILFFALSSCGGETSNEGGNGATGGSDGGMGGSAGGMGGAGGGSGATGGSGAAPAGGSSGCGPVDPGGSCSELGEIACLGAYPRCAPVYDDFCCPSCDPTGGCADCVDWRFLRCAAFDETSCVPGFVPACGNTPTWACQGGTADCSQDQPCTFVPGCTQAIQAGCPPNADCPSECHATSAWTCGPACTPSPMPLCEDGAPEYGPSGPTGWCVRAGLCAPGVCPQTPPVSGTPCSPVGLSCTYSGFCAPVCDCTATGVWQCLTPPC